MATPRSDRTLELLLTLDPTFQPWAVHIISTLRQLGVPAVIVDLGARRSLDEQLALVRSGRSYTPDSRHVTGFAFDLDVHGFNRDDVPMWFWQVYGQWVEQLGLAWGGRFRDFGHVEAPWGPRPGVL